MEVSAAILVKASNPTLGDLIYSMWDEETQPLDEDEVSPEFHAVFEELEFAETPTSMMKDGDNYFAFFDCMNGMSALSELTAPYKGSKIDYMLIVIAAEEGQDWYKLKGNNVKSFRPKYRKDDLFAALQLNATT